MGKGHRYRWVFKNKLANNGIIAEYKACLVANGYTQVSGVDYFNTCSPVCHYAMTRILLALVSIEKWVVHQMDVKIAFLNGDLMEEIYMAQPEGYVLQGCKSKVCKLVKSLYGLEQAPKMWHEKFDKTINNNVFVSSLSDRYLYNGVNSDLFAIICLYIDDMLVIGSNFLIVEELKLHFLRHWT